jgi:Ni/Fe-hydrogenase subunit HybB-like protein
VSAVILDANHGLLPPGESYASITAAVADPLLERRMGWRWWTALAVAGVFVLVTAGATVWLLVSGVGIWGINTTVVWGFAIANYVWWIGIGNAGTLISSLLLLTRQRWRASINRFAEAMTLFAAAIAGLFPILHLGRPMYFYWLAPYPNTMGLWPQWRSALVWDFWAILSYILFSFIFWYVGLIPDLATLRDRARSRTAQLLFGAFALGWRGSASHWRHYQTFYLTMAALAVPLVISVHSIVGLDFAASLMPGWQETIFPPYFVVGAMFSGFAMVVVLAASIRYGLSLESLITKSHFEGMAKILLMGSIIMGISYATEWFMGWYAGDPADRSFVANLFVGAYAPLYWLLLVCNVAVPQALWLRRIRASIPALVVIAILINVGMWLERILIIWETLSNGYLPGMRRLFVPTMWDWIFLIGPLGLFAFLFLIFVRLIPVVSMHEVRALCHARAP